MTNYFEILSAFVVILLVIYYYYTSTFDFWKQRGVPGPRPKFAFGNIKDVILRKKSMGEYLQSIYEEYKNEPMVGIFARRTPTLVIQNLDLIRDIIIKDFTHFADRFAKLSEKAEPLMATNLFFTDRDTWRPLRMNWSPVFTIGKLKDMFHLITECSNELEKYVDKAAATGKAIDCRDVATKFTIDVIGSCAFGINMNAMTDEGSEFRRMSKKLFEPSFERLARRFLRESVPKFYNILAYVLPHMETTTFITRVINDTIKYREENNISRPDFVNMLMNLQKHPEKLGQLKLTDTVLPAQSYVFFTAGFETSSAAIAFTLYEVARNLEVQEKLREEIIEQCGDDENLNYDVIKEMKYIDKVFKETLRKYPPVTNLVRRSKSGYTFNGTKISIPKDTDIIIPIQAILMDPSIFPNPEIFDPERFNEDSVAARHAMSYLPFGDGPRNCIGARFAALKVKIAIIKILRKFRVDVCEETNVKFVPHTLFLLVSEEGIRLKFTKLSD